MYFDEFPNSTDDFSSKRYDVADINFDNVVTLVESNSTLACDCIHMTDSFHACRPYATDHSLKCSNNRNLFVNAEIGVVIFTLMWRQHRSVQ